MSEHVYFGERESDPGMTWIFGVSRYDARPGTTLRRGGDGKIFTVVDVDTDGVVRCISDDSFITDEMLHAWMGVRTDA